MIIKSGSMKCTGSTGGSSSELEIRKIVSQYETFSFNVPRGGVVLAITQRTEDEHVFITKTSIKRPVKNELEFGSANQTELHLNAGSYTLTRETYITTSRRINL